MIVLSVPKTGSSRCKTEFKNRSLDKLNDLAVTELKEEE
jgi:hypothetical protein